MFNIDKKIWEEKKGFWTAKEILQQPNTWEKTLRQIKESYNEINEFIKPIIKSDNYEIVFTGAGTSEFVGNSIFSYLNKTNDYHCRSYATTDILATPENYLSETKPTLLVSFGRSGNSPESVATVEVANVVCKKICHLFITCNNKGDLAEFAKNNENCLAVNLTSETHDKSFAMTSSFSNMYLAAVLIFSLDKLDNLDQSVSTVVKNARNLLDIDYQKIVDIVAKYDFKRIVYLGSNSQKGVAQESSLKMLELTAGRVVTMYDTPLGFRHGPKSIINDETLIVIYVSDDSYTRKYELDIIKEMSKQRKGDKILAITTTFDSEIEALVDFYYSFDNNLLLDNVFSGLEYIVVAQIISLFKSLSLDITPDNPCPTGEVNRVVTGVTIYPYDKGEK